MPELVNSENSDMSQTHCIRLLDDFVDNGHLMLVFPRQDRNLRSVFVSLAPLHSRSCLLRFASVSLVFASFSRRFRSCLLFSLLVALCFARFC